MEQLLPDDPVLTISFVLGAAGMGALLAAVLYLFKRRPP